MNQDIFKGVEKTPTYQKLNEKTIEIEGELWSVTIHAIDGINVFLTSVKTDHCVMSMSTPAYDKEQHKLMDKSQIKLEQTAQFIAQKIAARVTEELRAVLPIAEKFTP